MRLTQTLPKYYNKVPGLYTSISACQDIGNIWVSTHLGQTVWQSKNKSLNSFKEILKALVERVYYTRKSPHIHFHDHRAEHGQDVSIIWNTYWNLL